MTTRLRNTTARHSLLRHSIARRIAARFGTRFNLTMALGLLILTIGELLLARRVHLGATAQLLETWPGFLLVLASLAYCESRPLPKLVDPCELILWAILSSNILALMVQLAARSPYPLVDAQLAALDRSMHFSTAAVVKVVANIPVAQDVLALAYAAVPLLVFAAILVPPLFGQQLASRRYIVAVIVTTIFTSILFALWPACGPWTTEKLHTTPEQAAITARLLLLKSAPMASLNLEHSAIVSFPSFHVVLALLSGIALDRVPRVRLFSRILAALTCVSTITTGWHYGFDLLGGLAVALAGWSIAKRAITAEAGTNRVPVSEPLALPVDDPACSSQASCG